MKNILNNFNRLIATNELIKTHDRVLLALSGGADSVALLYLLLAIRNKKKLTIAAAHLNHGLRRSASDRDEAFVIRLCKKKGIPCFTHSIDVRSYSKKNQLGIEEASRECRTFFLTRLASRRRYNKIATAHTLNDQAETVLMRIIRGSGIRGLASMSSKRSLGRVEIIRPLLGIQKNDLLHFLKRAGIKHREDATNLKNCFTRNRIRRELLPLIRSKYNPQFEHSLVDLAEFSEKTNDFIKQAVDRQWTRIVISHPNKMELRLGRLILLHPLIRNEIYRLSLSTLTGHLKKIRKEHYDSIDGMIFDKKLRRKGQTASRHVLSLPYGLRVSCSRDRIAFRKTRRSSLRYNRTPRNQ